MDIDVNAVKKSRKPLKMQQHCQLIYPNENGINYFRWLRSEQRLGTNQPQNPSVTLALCNVISQVVRAPNTSDSMYTNSVLLQSPD